VQPPRQRQPSLKVPTSAPSQPIQHQFSPFCRHRRPQVDYCNYCDQTGSNNLDDNSRSNNSPTGRDSTSPDLSMHYPNAPYQQPVDPSRQATTTQSTTQHATSISYPPTTILPTYPAYKNTGYTPSTATTLPNPPSNPNNYGYAYRRPGFGAGATRTTVYSMTSGISYTNATYIAATTSSTPAPYYGTTTMANASANASANTVTAPAVTKTPVPVPLRTFRTVLLTVRAAETVSGSSSMFLPALPSIRLPRWKWQVEVERRRKGM